MQRAQEHTLRCVLVDIKLNPLTVQLPMVIQLLTELEYKAFQYKMEDSETKKDRRCCAGRSSYVRIRKENIPLA